MTFTSVYGSSCDEVKRVIETLHAQVSLAEKHGPFAFPDFLRLQLAATTARTGRTRLRLEIAAAELLQEHGFHELKISAICARADCGHGTFYRYWPDREAVARDVMRDLMGAIRLRRPPLAKDTPLFQRLYLGHIYYINVYRLNAGLMRCMTQLNTQLPGFAEIGAEANHRLAQRVVGAFYREGLAEGGPDTQRIHLATARSCIAMVDGMLRGIFIYGVEHGLTPEQTATLMSQIWYRAFMGRDP